MPTLAELLELQNNPQAYVGYPQLQRQAARMRQAQAGREAENLPDPRTYGFLRGLLGANPDELGMSVLSPNTAKAKEAAYYGAQLSNLAQIAPAMMPATKAALRGAGGAINDAMVYGTGPLARITPQPLRIVEDASYPNNPANKELLRTVAGDHSPVGMINQPIKGAKLVNIPIEMIEHGEAVMPGGTLTFAGARKKIEEYAKKETPIPPIDVVSGEGGKPWMVADGSHRLEAAKLRGEKTIPAYVSPHDKEGLEQIAKFKMNAKDAKPSKVAQTSDGYKFYEQPDGTWTNGDMTFKSIDELFSTDPQLTVNGKIYSPKAWMKEESKGSDVHTLDYDRTFDPNYDASKGTFAHLYKKGFR